MTVTAAGARRPLPAQGRSRRSTTRRRDVQHRARFSYNSPMRWAAAERFIAGSGRWRFAIGDRNAVAWLTVGAYALAAALAARAFLAARAGQRLLAPIDPREARNQALLKRVWLLIAITLVALGINKQLDLQTLFVQTVRDRAFAGGWYDDRRGYQEDFIVVVLALGMIATILLAVSLRHVIRRVVLAVVGMGLLVSFVVIRASSFHYVDAVLALGTIRLNWIIELAGIGLMIASALHWRWAERNQIAAAIQAATARTTRDEPADGGHHVDPAVSHT